MDFDADTEAILGRIHGKGYWRVLIRPLSFQRDLLSLSECASTLQECVVRFRGWDYPYVSGARQVGGGDFVQHTEEWRFYRELCRLYRSGQFIHHFACGEDYENWPQEAASSSETTVRVLRFISTAFTVTEILEFASRLALKEVLGSECLLEISLHGMKGRYLWDSSRLFRRRYECETDPIQVSDTFRTEEIIESAPKIARKVYTEIFHNFDFLELREDALVEDQKKLLEKRL